MLRLFTLLASQYLSLILHSAVAHVQFTIYDIPSITHAFHIYTLTTASSVNNALLTKKAENGNVVLINTHHRSRDVAQTR